jgi:hypothetical protein
MKIRSASPCDARGIAEVHVSSWRIAYEGVMPVAVLDALSVDKREQFWRESLSRAERHAIVAEDHDGIIGRSRAEQRVPSEGSIRRR